MLNITFVSQNSSPELEEAAKGYKEIWDKEGEKIVAAMEGISGLRLKEENTEATVYNGKSHSHPLHLRANLSIEEKQATLVHELCHILLVDNGIKVHWDSPEEKLAEIHKVLNLFFYDVIVSLWGEKFADDVVALESNLGGEYKMAWGWALSFSKKERTDKFSEIVKNNTQS